jgi:CheY-like chemotaxis protein
MMNFSDFTYLYVEDDPMSREVMSMLMENVMQVKKLIIFDDSTDFIEKLTELYPKPDLIMLDIHMLPVDGFTMLRQIHADHRYEHVPVIALTASVMNEEVHQLKNAGFDGAIAKPIDVTTFPDLIKQVMTGKMVWHVA